MQRLIKFTALCFFGVIGAFVLMEWLAGCGETYIDSKGARHVNECLFFSAKK